MIGSVNGVEYEITYDTERRNAEFVPGEPDLQCVDDAAVVGFFTSAASWAARFQDSNPEWKVNGVKREPEPIT